MPTRTATSRRAQARDMAKSISFAGGTDYIEYNNPSNFVTGSSSFSVFSWIKTSTTGVRQAIFSFGQGGSLNNNKAAYLYVSTGNLPKLDLAQVAGPTGTVTLTDNVWHLVGVVNNAGTMQLYVDGKADGASQAMSPIIALGLVRTARSLNGDSAFAFTGLIDEPRIYQRALTATEITELYLGFEPATTNLLGLWRFNEGTGITAADESGAANDGVLTNSPTWSTTVPTDVIGRSASAGRVAATRP